RFGDFIDQQAIRRMELPRAPRRQAAGVRVAFRLFRAANLVERFRPRHEWNFAHLDIRRQIDAVFSRQRACTCIPVTQFAGRRAEHWMSVRVAWGRCGGRPWRLTASTTLLSERGNRKEQEDDCQTSNGTNWHVTAPFAFTALRLRS